MTTTLEGVDYSYARPNLSALHKTAHGAFRVAYITKPGVGAKGVTQAEINTMIKLGMPFAFVYEYDAGRALKGKAAGIADAKAAQANLHALKGVSDQRPIYFAVDFDATPAQQGAIDNYFKGVASVIGLNRTGVYAGYYPLARLAKAGLVKWLWQTYAWSGGALYKGVHLYQYRNGQTLAGGTVDFVRSYQKDYGQRGLDTIANEAKANASAAAKAASDKARAEKAAAEAAAKAAADAKKQEEIKQRIARLGRTEGFKLGVKEEDNPEIYVLFGQFKYHLTPEEWHFMHDTCGMSLNRVLPAGSLQDYEEIDHSNIK